MSYKQLSKTLSYALRHAPEKFGLQLNDEGFVAIDDIIAVLKKSSKKWENLDLATIEALLQSSKKQRFELKNGQIRALYGHSIAQKIAKKTSAPPKLLYHGTARKVVRLIQQHGLHPMGRQYVHLSVDIKTATTVGKRHDTEPVILVIDAYTAYQKGIVSFYKEKNGIWLSDPIPPQYIQFG